VDFATAREHAPRSDRRGLQRAEGFFEGRSPTLVVSLGLAFLGVVGLVDHLSGPDLSLSLFYIMPVGLVTWNLGRRTGAWFVMLATLVGFVADLFTNTATNDVVPYWNAVVRFAVFITFSALIATLEDTIAAQRERADRAREVSVGLRELNEVKDTLLHAVSHDLKGPLAGIIGAMQTIRRGKELQLSDDEIESLYAMVEASGRRMNRLVDDMLDLERLDRGQVHPEREPTDVGELARRVVKELPGIGAHPVDVDADLALADIDPAKVERIIENLLVNAGRHTPPGTAVHVTVRARSDAIRLTVEDEGPGIPDVLRHTLFDPFRQGPNAAGRGVGIGLSLVRRFAQLHGGDAVVEDREGGGARFVIDIPGDVKSLETADESLRAG
jgi:signal transduction histidine kinase